MIWPKTMKNSIAILCGNTISVDSKPPELMDMPQANAAQERKEFFEALGREYGVLDHPKFDAICEKAWEDGHSEGTENVRIVFAELAELVR